MQAIFNMAATGLVAGVAVSMTYLGGCAIGIASELKDGKPVREKVGKATANYFLSGMALACFGIPFCIGVAITGSLPVSSGIKDSIRLAYLLGAVGAMGYSWFSIMITWFV